jgi:hypothetical protein
MPHDTPAISGGVPFPMHQWWSATSGRACSYERSNAFGKLSNEGLTSAAHLRICLSATATATATTASRRSSPEPSRDRSTTSRVLEFTSVFHRNRSAGDRIPAHPRNDPRAVGGNPNHLSVGHVHTTARFTALSQRSVEMAVTGLAVHMFEHDVEPFRRGVSQSLRESLMPTALKNV